MMSRVFTALILLAGMRFATSEITDVCIDCFAKVEMGTAGRCNMDMGSESCGTYQIKEVYWIDCGRPGGSYKSCAANDACARSCIKSYIRKYERICQSQLGRPQLTCTDYGRIHNGGPYACTARWTDYYVYTLMGSKCYHELREDRRISMVQQGSVPNTGSYPPTNKVAAVETQSSGPSDSCLACIAKVEMGKSGVCSGGLCGVYQISEPYWIDCGKPGRSYYDCTSDESCSKQCIRSYMERYAGICQTRTGRSQLTCIDYGRLHSGGPNGCTAKWTEHYVQLMNSKCA